MKRLRTRAAARLSVLVAISACALVASIPGALATHGGDREVTVASNDAIFSQNKQNEPAIAIDARIRSSRRGLERQHRHGGL